MYNTEAEYRRVLSGNLKRAGFSVQPIESGGTGSGVPDLYVSSKKHKFAAWIELKNFEIRNRKKVLIAFRPGQYAWLKSFSENGTICVLGVSTEYGESYFLNGEIFTEYAADAIIQRVVNWEQLLERIQR